MKMSYIKLLLAALLLGMIPGALRAQLSDPVQKPVFGARMPALSPDGKRIAFVYRGDVWTAKTKGGKAVPLTQHVELDAHPQFSPDGKWISFSSRRHGNWDIFVAPSDGGSPQRITRHAGTDISYGWSPDGKELVFGSKRDSPNYQLFAIDVKTLRLREITEDYAKMNHASFSPDGEKIVYGRYGFPWTRPRYTGSAAEQIWIYDQKRSLRYPIPREDRQHLWTRFMPDGKRLLTVTTGESTPTSHGLNETPPKLEDEPINTPNLWLLDFEGGAKQITEFSGWAVRWPTVAAKSGAIAFEYSGNLWRTTSSGRKPKKLTFFAATDEKETNRHYDKVTNGVVEAEPSPDGTTIAFGVKGDIWTIAITKPSGVAGRSAGFAKQLTHWEGDDSDFLWSKDSKKIYFVSDRNFNYGIFEVDVATGKTRTVWSEERDVTNIRLSKGGKKLGFWVTGAEGGLFAVDLKSGKSERIVHVPGPQWRGYGGGSFDWSPDGQWIAYTRVEDNKARNVWIVPAKGGEPVKVTRLNAFHSQPTWGPGGKYLFCYSSRSGSGIYAIPLKREGARIADTDIKFKKPGDKLKVEIDFKDIHRRIRRLHAKSGIESLAVTPKGEIIFGYRGDIYSLTYDGKTAKKLSSANGNSLIRPYSGGAKATFVRKGELYTTRLSGPSSGTKVTFTADWEHDVRARRKAAFTEFWRSFDRGFYDGNMHGRDWAKIREYYEPFLDAVDTREEFADLLNMVVGELESSHSEVKPASGGPSSAVTPRLGFTFDYSHAGPGIKVDKVPDAAPGSYDKTRINPGDYILEINGKDVELTEKYYEIVNHKEGRELALLVNDKPKKDGARTVKYKALSQTEWLKLNYNARTERLRKRVEDKTKGQIGYLHIASMGSGDRTKFEQEAYEYILGKDGLIIDVRFNSGGNISDTLIDWLERKPHGYTKPRDGAAVPSPARAWTKPIVVLLNEHSYSNAEMFPNAIRERGLAKLVGWQTPGYVIWTQTLSLVDGTKGRMPGAGVYRLDGSPMENRGERPDVEIWLHPDDYISGEDPQIDKAIEMLTSDDAAAAAGN
jgi:tricorn protease